MKHQSTLLAAAAMLLFLGAAPAIADDYDSGAATKDDLGVAGPHDDLTPGTPQGNTETAPGSMQDERGPASAGEDDLDVGQPEAAGRPDTNDDDEMPTVHDTSRPNPNEGDLDATDTAPAEQFGTPQGMDVEGQRGIPGGQSDEIRGYDEDAEIDAGSFESPRHQRNLQEALNPRNGHYHGRSGGGAAATDKREKPTADTDDDSVGDMTD